MVLITTMDRFLFIFSLLRQPYLWTSLSFVLLTRKNDLDIRREVPSATCNSLNLLGSLDRWPTISCDILDVSKVFPIPIINVFPPLPQICLSIYHCDFPQRPFHEMQQMPSYCFHSLDVLLTSKSMIKFLNITPSLILLILLHLSKKITIQS